MRAFANGEKDKLAEQLENTAMHGARFSLTIDEYTSFQNKRFMSLNLHGLETYWNLGVVMIQGTMPAERVKELVDSQLQRLKLNMNDHIVCSTTDGASVMVKFGRLVLPEQQLCYVHAVHLAVTDVLYRRRNQEEPAPTACATASQIESEDKDDGSDTTECDTDSADKEEDRYQPVRVTEEMHSSMERV